MPGRDADGTPASALLDRAAGHVASAVQAALRGSDVTLEKWRVLDVLAAREGMTMSELAGAAMVTGPTLTRIVDDLATRALVLRDVDTHDRRRVLVHLAPRGRRLRRSLLPAVRHAETEALSELSQQDVDALVVILSRLTGHPDLTPSRKA